jgi:hypothetical protein
MEIAESEKNKQSILDGIKEHIKKVPKRIDGSRIRKDRVDNETATAAANDSRSIPRKLRKAEKQRRQEVVTRGTHLTYRLRIDLRRVKHRKVCEEWVRTLVFVVKSSKL